MAIYTGSTVLPTSRVSPVIAAQQRNFAACVLVVHRDALSPAVDGPSSAQHHTQRFTLQTLPLSAALGLDIRNWHCFDEAQTPSAARAPCFSGVLLPGGWVLTALHGRRAAPAAALLRDFRFLLGYEQRAGGDVPEFIERRTLFQARRLLCGVQDGPNAGDWALFELEAAPEHLPAAVELRHKDPAPGAPLYLCGFPYGMPLRVSDGGSWLQSVEPGAFQSRLSAFRCESGAAVFDATDHGLVGCLLAGQRDLRAASPDATTFEWCVFGDDDSAAAELCSSVQSLPQFLRDNAAGLPRSGTSRR